MEDEHTPYLLNGGRWRSERDTYDRCLEEDTEDGYGDVSESPLTRGLLE